MNDKSGADSAFVRIQVAESGCDFRLKHDSLFKICKFSVFPVREGHEFQDVAMQATTRLRQVLTNEREVKLKSEDAGSCM